MFLVIVDSHSKWLEVHVTHSASSAVVIEKFQTTFAALGLPETIVSDNGMCFSIKEFQTFVKKMESNISEQQHIIHSQMALLKGMFKL